MIDTHFHLYDQAFDNDRPLVVERARQAGVTQCIMPGIDRSVFDAQSDCAARYAPFCAVALGLHPTSVTALNYRQELEFVAQTLEKTPDAVAVGEIGLDTYWSADFIKEQTIVFEEQLRLAAFYRLPVIIHTRSCFPELLNALQRNRSLGLTGTLHAWSAGLEVFEQANKYGHFLMGVGGVLTFKKAHLAQIVRQVPLSEILLETDAPWLTPAPFRGQRNESAYIRYVLETLALIKEMPADQVDAQTTQNARQLFHLTCPS